MSEIRRTAPPSRAPWRARRGVLRTASIAPKTRTTERGLDDFVDMARLLIRLGRIRFVGRTCGPEGPSPAAAPGERGVPRPAVGEAARHTHGVAIRAPAIYIDRVMADPLLPGGKRVLDMDKIAKGLGAERRGKVAAGGGHFGAHGLAAEVQARFRVPAGGGRASVPEWTERRLLPLAPKTLTRIEDLAARLRSKSGVGIEPMQLAALLLERIAGAIGDDELEEVAALPLTQRKAAG